MRSVSKSVKRLTALFLCLAMLMTAGCDDGNSNPAADTKPPGKGSEIGHEIASSGAAIGLAALLAGASVPLGGTIGAEVAGVLMALIFSSGGSDPDAEILDKLDQIQQTLQQIETQLAAISSQLKAIEAQLAIDTSDIERTVVTGGLNPYVTHINNLWNQYLVLRNSDGTWNTDNAYLTSLTYDILDSNNGAFLQLVGIHDGLTGEGGVSAAILEAVAENATLHTNAGGEHFEGYLLIENYFGAMLRAQTRGATLMVEALRYREADTARTLPGTYPGDAVQFMDWYRAHIEDQVEVFLRATEQFVTKTAVLTKGMDDFVPDVQDIFWRADLTAAWLSRRHRASNDAAPSLLVYRVIGSPQRVEQYGSGFDVHAYWPGVNVMAHFDTMLYSPSGIDPAYDVPAYAKVNHHSYHDIGTTPYVQFLTPQGTDGAMQKGAIASAEEIMVGKYEFGGFNDPATVVLEYDYYLEDIPCHDYTHVDINYFDASGHASDADNGIKYGCHVDIQHPSARHMGDWQFAWLHWDDGRLSDQDTNDTGEVSHLDGSCQPQAQWVQLGGMAYPRAEGHPVVLDDLLEQAYPSAEGIPRSGQISLDGYYIREYGLVAYYYWADDTAMKVRPHARVTIDSTIHYNGYPADRWIGMWFHFGKAWGDVTDNPIPLESYDTGRLVRQLTLDPGGSLLLQPDNDYYCSWSSRADIDYTGKSSDSDADWHHWRGTIRTVLEDFWFTID